MYNEKPMGLTSDLNKEEIIEESSTSSTKKKVKGCDWEKFCYENGIDFQRKIGQEANAHRKLFESVETAINGATYLAEGVNYGYETGENWEILLGKLLECRKILRGMDVYDKVHKPDPRYNVFGKTPE